MTITPDIIREIVDNEQIYIEFQPIFSINTKKIIGVEALSRGVFGNLTIPPLTIFEYSKSIGLTLGTDRLCRKKALEAFKSQNISDTIFINFDTSLLEDSVDYEGFLTTVSSYNVPAENIVIEINGARIKNNFKMSVFVNFCRESGFLIALDNIMSVDDANTLISLANPDFIKIDRAITADIDTDENHRNIFKGIINAAKRVGALTIAVGTETVDEVITCMLLGADYFQGYFFSRPERFNRIYSTEVRIKLEEAAKRLNINIKNNPTAEGVRIENYKRIIYNLISHLAGIPETAYTAVMESFLGENPEIECIFLIDENGFQITRSILPPSVEIMPGCHPALPGESHSIKNYFYAVREQIEDPFISGRYVSEATGHYCKTVSSKFFSDKRKMIIACVDLVI
ncbi:MAG: EAL domain-containing protein [Ruminococcus sp.]|jgi:EAL domain-containing protein (putative c-di-GMP-specific phosphodiesterase class I)|nr:EAL domain-containing protein [Ruminococcus sp.]